MVLSEPAERQCMVLSESVERQCMELGEPVERQCMVLSEPEEKTVYGVEWTGGVTVYGVEWTGGVTVYGFMCNGECQCMELSEPVEWCALCWRNKMEWCSIVVWLNGVTLYQPLTLSIGVEWCIGIFRVMARLISVACCGVECCCGGRLSGGVRWMSEVWSGALWFYGDFFWYWRFFMTCSRIIVWSVMTYDGVNVD